MYPLYFSSQFKFFFWTLEQQIFFDYDLISLYWKLDFLRYVGVKPIFNLEDYEYLEFLERFYIKLNFTCLSNAHFWKLEIEISANSEMLNDSSIYSTRFRQSSRLELQRPRAKFRSSENFCYNYPLAGLSFAHF